MSNINNSFIASISAKREKIGAQLAKKEIEFAVDLVAGIVVLFLSLALYFAIPYQIEINADDAVNGRQFPYMIVILMMACSAFLIVKECIKVFKGLSLEKKKISLLVEVKALSILLIFLCTYFIAKYTDLFILGALFCSLSFLIYFNCYKLNYYLITIVLTILIYCAFKFGLNVNF